MASEQSPEENTSWGVYGIDVMRGNVASHIDSNDPRMNVGWSESASRQPEAQGQKAEDSSATDSSGHVDKYDKPIYLWDSDYGNGFTGANHNAGASNYPHPELSLPHPTLNLDFRMSVLLNPRISVGATPFGQRNWISFTGGTWSGSWGSGTVLPGGQDNQLVIADGSSRLETTYLLQTHDTPPAYIVIKTKGWRTGPPEILAQLADPEKADNVDPNSYKFRLFAEMETGDQRYAEKVNCGMWVGSGMRKGAEVIYDAYRVS
ncbi:hypothetical protein ACMFMG_007152 [Clarireedia jacksonii]